MSEIAEEEGHAAIHGALDQWRGLGVAREEALGVVSIH
jgi:hypothetical protein